MRPLFFYLLPVFLSLSLTTHAQADNPYLSVWYSADNNSLPQNSVKAIVKDKYGFIWLATESGMVCYDGSRFKVFDNQNIEGISNSRMSNFLDGSVSRDSIITWHISLCYLLIKNREVTKVNVEDMPLKYKILWFKDEVSTRSKKFHFNKGYYEIRKNNITQVDNHNNIKWQLACNNSDDMTFFICNDKLFAIDIHGRGYQLYDGEMHGVNVRGWKKGGALIINHMMQQAFLHTDTGLYIIREQGGELYFEPVLKNYDLNDKNYECAFYDEAAKTIYLGSTTDGLHVVKKKRFKTVLGVDKGRLYYAMIPWTDSTSLATTGEEISSNRAVKKYRFNDTNDHFNMLRDRNGNIWVKSSRYTHTLFCYKKNTEYTTFEKWEFKDRMQMIHESIDGRIFIGTSIAGKSSGRLFVYDPNKKKSGFKLFMSLTFGPSYAIQNDKDILWLGSEVGMYKVNIEQKTQQSIECLKKTYIRSMKFEGKNRMWVTTYDSGFYLYDIPGRKIVQFPLDDKKNLLSSHYLMEDRNGYIWIPTNKGLYQCSKKNLLEYAARKTSNVYYHHYEMSDGFLTNEFNGGCQPGGVSLQNGFFGMPSMKGNVYFRPDDILPDFPVNPVYLGKVELDGKNLKFRNDTVVTSQNFGNLRLYLTSPYYGNRDNVSISIKLEGPVTQSWKPYDDGGVLYGRLPPGSYRLIARKLTGFDANYTYKTFTIIVPATFWQTPYFRALVAVAILVVCFYFIRMRTRYIQKKNDLLEKKISEQTHQLRKTITTLRRTKNKLGEQIKNHKKLIASVTHDIKSPLRFLALTGKHVYNNMSVVASSDVDTTEMLEHIKSIHTSSSQLYNFVDNLLEYAKINEEEPQQDPYPLYNLAEEKIEIFLGIAQSKRIKVHNRIDVMLMAKANRLLISIIIHNLLDNAIKNTFSGTIIFTAEKEKGHISLKIEDTGKGMDTVTLKQYMDIIKKNTNKGGKKTGMGLRMIGDLVSILEGTIDITSRQGIGTAVTVSFPNRGI